MRWDEVIINVCPVHTQQEMVQISYSEKNNSQMMQLRMDDSKYDEIGSKYDE